MYLKPTQTLWKQVESKIESMFEERLKYAADWFHYGMKQPEFDRRCIACVITPEEDVMVQKLGSRWFSPADTISVIIHNGAVMESYELPAKTGGRAPYVSPHWHSYYDANKPKVTDEAILAIAKLRREAQAKISAERDAFQDEVKAIWEQAPSVNSLAKAWPPIIDLLPPDVVKQLERKTTRRTAKQLSESIDTKTLSVRILKAKVAQ